MKYTLMYQIGTKDIEIIDFEDGHIAGNEFTKVATELLKSNKAGYVILHSVISGLLGQLIIS
jgi:hypothetical protein